MTKPVWYEVEGVALAPGEAPQSLYTYAARELGVAPETIGELEIVRRSVDARKKGHVLIKHTVQVATTAKTRPSRAVKELHTRGAVVPLIPRVKRQERIVILGAGPAGGDAFTRCISGRVDLNNCPGPWKHLMNLSFLHFGGGVPYRIELVQ